jgi:hypothetical protein
MVLGNGRFKAEVESLTGPQNDSKKDGTTCWLDEEKSS